MDLTVVTSGILLFSLLYYLFFRNEYFTSSRSGTKKLWVLAAVFFIRLVALYFTNGDVYVLQELTKTTIERGYPYVGGLPTYVSYWSDHNPLGMYVCHPPLVFYIYAPIVALLGEASMIFTTFLFLLSINVVWNWFERNNSDPLIPCLLYGTFPLFYLESLTHISLNIALIAVLAVGITNFLDYKKEGDKSRLNKTVLCFALAPLIEYSAILFLGFFSLYFILTEKSKSKALIALFIIWSPFVLWNVYADFPIFHSYAFTYTSEHHFNESLPYGEAVRSYYRQHENAIFPYYFMDNVFFAFINFGFFLNGNLLLLGNKQKRGWNSVLFLAILTQLLMLTFYAVFGYQSHPLANFARYIIPSAFLIVPFSLRTDYPDRWKMMALALIFLNMAINLAVVFNGGFQWVTVKWVSPY